ncbi:unnamed protein product [Phytomonas sp. EM1]|nr:unnamed protein product [Phytomonas sp. EM1]|eukprot:CCW62754.1 unnamed protein product [Phytomonas sp. isolate EM1]
MSQAVEGAILKALLSEDVVSSDTLATKLGLDHQEVVGASKSLESDGYILSKIASRSVWKLTDEAHQIISNGSPEYNLFQMLEEKELSQSEVEERMGKAIASIAVSNGMKAKILNISKKNNETFISRRVKSFTDETREALKRAVGGEEVGPNEVAALKRRKLASLEVSKFFELTKGSQYSAERRSKAVGDLTAKMLQDGSWSTTNFKEYNFEAAAPEADVGQLHPLLKVRQEFREIFMELGFQEMETQHWVESSFWNFDSLFIPQQHPARDVQDTFFISKPAVSEITRRAFLERVRAAHEKAFRTTWKEEEASRNVLRTHTTGSSAYTLYKLALQSGVDTEGRCMFRPGRYYSIDRVFRNEQMDRTHLCEFHQVEGFVIDRDISLAKMMHTFDQFFRRIGIEKLRFKPAFNPYTEPSMEIFGYHNGLKKWIEVGNSGLFRPELLGPMGFDAGVQVMAWGLSLERPTMIKYGINNIHELFGHKVDIKFIKHAAIARF